MHHLSVRVAWHEGAIIYDLGDGRAVRISRDGWDLQHTPPVLFRRFAHQRPQVEPVPGGRLEELLEFANLLPEDRHGSVSGDRLLAITYPVVGLVPAIVHVVLAIQGEQGSGKSTKMKVYKALIDPSHVGLISPPPNLREFVQVCSHHWVCFLDNVSGFPDWLSDAICRACTGEGFSKRELYSDDQDIIYAYKRILGLNGVILAASKADLLDRCLALRSGASHRPRPRSSSILRATSDGSGVLDRLSSSPAFRTESQPAMVNTSENTVRAHYLRNAPPGTQKTREAAGWNAIMCGCHHRSGSCSGGLISHLP